ncbi:MAG: hypothetical protein ACHQCF_05170 [Solirubrobacterales bacterium]
MGGHRTHSRYSRLRAIGAGFAFLTLAASLAACGGGSSSDANEPAGTYRVKVVNAEFPTKQRLGQTSLLRIGIRNTGSKTVPSVAVTISIAGRAGQTSSLPFGIHDPQPELAQPDRPVWVLAEHFPKLAGSEEPGGAETSSPKTFLLGSLKPAATVEGIWKLSAVKAGRYTLLYGVEGGLSGSAKAQTATGVKPGGSFVVGISEKPPNTIVTDSGQIVEIGKPRPGSK